MLMFTIGKHKQSKSKSFLFQAAMAVATLALAIAALALTGGSANAQTATGHEWLLPSQLPTLQVDGQPGDGEVTLVWNRVPSRWTGWWYEVQWKEGNGAWGSWNAATDRDGRKSHWARKYTAEGLTNDSEYTFRLRARLMFTYSTGDSTGVLDIYTRTSNEVTATPRANDAPSFTDGASATRSVNSGASAGTNVGRPVAATDGDGDTLEYYFNGGHDVEYFTVVSTTGQLQTSGLSLQGNGPFTFSLYVSDGKNGGVDEITVTVNLTSLATSGGSSEPPRRPTSQQQTSIPAPTSEASIPAPTPEPTPEPTPAPTLLTAAWSPPSSHDGTAFTFPLSFNKPVNLSFRNLRDVIIEADGGSVTKSKRVQKGSNQNWNVTIVPDGTGDITLRLNARGSCGDKTAICSKDGELLSAGLTNTVPGQ